MNTVNLRAINEEALKIAATIKVLEPLSWPKELEHDFHLAQQKSKLWRPQIEYPKIDHSLTRESLQKLISDCCGDHPMEIFTRLTLESYVDAVELVDAAGSSRVQELSEKLFGRPSSTIPGTSVTNLEMAEKLIRITREFIHPYMAEPELRVQAEDVKLYLEEHILKKMQARGPVVQIVDNLTAKATASSKAIKLRAGTSYSQYDFAQLLEHEVMIHALTAINGQRQSILKVMGRGAPRTTLTQEGLATFAEVITGSIDIYRLNRIALRIVAIDRALNGADFKETYDFFLENGQSAKESFWSAARVFRGGYPNKNIIFTKDAVYLDGLIKVHSLFKWALAKGHLGLTHLLFCGRLTIEDLFLLEDSYKEGLIEAPEFYPGWYERIQGFAGKLSFSFLAHEFNFSEVEDYFTRRRTGEGHRAEARVHTSAQQSIKKAQA